MTANKKLTDDEIRAIWGDERPYKQIQADFGVSGTTVSLIKNGKHSATARLGLEPNPRYTDGEPRPATNWKLTEDQARAIHAADGTYLEIAERFGTTQSHVCKIKTGQSWISLGLEPKWRSRRLQDVRG